MSAQFLNLTDIHFTYENMAEPLFSGVSLQFPAGWTGITGANGTGKTTLLKVCAGIIKPDKGSVVNQGKSYYCEQNTEQKPAGYKALVAAYSKESYLIMDMLGVREEWFGRWNSLSEGEKRRCQLAVALHKSPDVLAIDEPTNHLDTETRNIIINALQRFKGIGLLISHDRQLLDTLCDNTLILKPGKYIFRQGKFSDVTETLQQENKANLHLLEAKEKEIKKLQKEVAARKRKASSADAKKSKKHMDKKDHDAKAKMDIARLTGKDATEGKIYNRLSSRLEKMESIKDSIEYEKGKDFGIEFNSSERSKRNIIFLEEGLLSAGDKALFRYPALQINKGEKTGLTGSNGAGKTTFINYILRENLNNVKCLYLKQEVTLRESRGIINKIKKLDNADKGKIITIIDKLGSDPKRVLETENPSPGEARKLILAEGLLHSPDLIIMDEPTNHMDITSVISLENALREVDIAMLLVSHDKVFLDNVINREWNISDGKLKVL